MAATVNGLSLSKLRAFGATFFIFSDYARPAMRLSALMELPTLFVFTHDAMGDGEDGPTHQPVEQLISLRAVPGLVPTSRAMPTRLWKPTVTSFRCDIHPPCWPCRGSRCPRWIGTSMRGLGSELEALRPWRRSRRKPRRDHLIASEQ